MAFSSDKKNSVNACQSEHTTRHGSVTSSGQREQAAQERDKIERSKREMEWHKESCLGTYVANNESSLHTVATNKSDFSFLSPATPIIDSFWTQVPFCALEDETGFFLCISPLVSLSPCEVSAGSDEQCFLKKKKKEWMLIYYWTAVSRSFRMLK